MKLIRTIKQHDKKDCGAACLCTISQFFGRKYSLRYMRKITHTGQNGVTLQGMVDGANKIGMFVEAYEATLDEMVSYLEHDGNPVVAHLRTNHFVTVYRAKNKKIYVSDPAIGKYKVSNEEFDELWSGYLMIFSDILQSRKDLKSEKRETAPSNLIMSVAKENWKGLVFIVLMSWVLIGISLCSSYMFQVLLEHGNGRALTHIHDANIIVQLLSNIANHGIKTLFIFMIILTFTLAIMGFLRDKAVATLSKKMDISLMDEYTRRLFKASISELTTRMSGDYISRTSDLVMVRNLISGLMVGFFMDVNLFVIGSILLFQINISLFFVVIGTLFLYGLLACVLRNPLTTVSHSAMNANATVQTYLKESVQGIEFVKTNNLESNVQMNLMKRYKKFLNEIFKGNMISAYSNSGSALIEQISNLIIIFAGFSFVNSGGMSLGELMTFFMLLSLLSGSSKEILTMQQSFQAGLVAIERLNDIRYMEEDSEGEIGIEKIKEIKVDNIEFSYFGRGKLFENVSFEVSGTKKFAIVGQNGCGKSTLLRLIMGIDAPNSGQILINGIDIKKIKTKDLRNRMGFVKQDVFLFADTLLYNITLGKEYPLEEIENVCDQVGLNDFLNKMPQGLNTFIDENAINLSAGQKQAISLARVLIRKPDVLILDEVTSNIDSDKEERIISRLMDLDIPCIYVTHNRVIATKADDILDLSRKDTEKTTNNNSNSEEVRLCVS